MHRMTPAQIAAANAAQPGCRRCHEPMWEIDPETCEDRVRACACERDQAREAAWMASQGR